MTTLGLQYLQHTENQRHNARIEAETERSNRELERLTGLRDQETARANAARENETSRANRNEERLKKLDVLTRAQTSRYTADSTASNVAAQIASNERQTADKIAQSDRANAVAAQTAKDTSGLSTLTNLFNTLVGAITKSKSRRK